MKKNKIKISVIITAFNEEKFIGRCLRSIISQSFPRNDYEVIVVNDASTDKTNYALSLFGDSIKVITNKTNIGLPASINRGIKAAKGKYFVRLDADDYVNSNYLNFLYYFLENNIEYDAVACDYFLFDDKENWLEKCNSSKRPIGCGIMFKREHIINLGMYDESFSVHEDKDMMIRFKTHYKLGHLNLPLYRYRKHEHNITKDLDLMKKHRERLKLKHYN